MKMLNFVLVALLVTFVSNANALTIKGAVVHVNKKNQTFVVADKKGTLYSIHASKLPKRGKSISASVTQLLNKTYKAVSVKNIAAAKVAKVSGTVSYVNARKKKVTVSSRGASISFRVKKSSVLKNLRVGSFITASVDDLNNPDISSVVVSGTDSNGIEMEAYIDDVDDVARTISVSTDDSNGDSATSLVINVPDTIDISLFNPDDVVSIVVQIQTDGSYTLLDASVDNNSEDANNPDLSSGDDGDYSGAGDSGPDDGGAGGDPAVNNPGGDIGGGGGDDAASPGFGDA